MTKLVDLAKSNVVGDMSNATLLQVQNTDNYLIGVYAEVLPGNSLNYNLNYTDGNGPQTTVEREIDPENPITRLAFVRAIAGSTISFSTDALDSAVPYNFYATVSKF